MEGHPARFWKPLQNGAAQCRLCNHFCEIPAGGRGWCGVRENRGGRLVSLAYGLPEAISVDPMEKKPLHHFLPGTATFSLGTMGCDMRCSFCQNASLSQPPRLGRGLAGRRAAPDEIVAAALDSGCRSISYTYSEPTVFFEYAEDTARLARTKGLENVLVTNGYMSPECLDACGPADTGPFRAANVDLKAFSDAFYRERCGATLKPVLENLKRMRALGWWIEVTTLLIPGLNDDPKELAALAVFLTAELGPDTPWHISRFHPDYALLDRPATPLESLAAARDIGRAAGLRYVYVGNASGPGFGDTVCPSCGAVVVRREGFSCDASGLADGRCRACGTPIAGVWG